MYVVFLGGPAVGKGTQCQRLSRYLNATHIASGELLRAAKEQESPLARRIAELMDAGDLVPDELVLEMVGERLRSLSPRASCLFDGVPRTVAQAKLLDELLASFGSTVDLAMELYASPDILTQRMQHRAAIEGRVDDTPETLHHRLQVYAAQAEPLLEYYRQRGVLHSFDAAASPDQVFERVLNCIQDVAQAI